MTDYGVFLPITCSIFVIVFCIWAVINLIILPLVTKKKRQIVQIATSHENDLVLCDDNTLWMYRHGVWSRVPDVPQDEQEKST
jgi:hypothetical protein